MQKLKLKLIVSIILQKSRQESIKKMLERDKYVEDPVYKYFPNFSLEKFHDHVVSMNKPYQKLIFNVEQAERWNSRVNYVNNIVAGVFTIMLLPIIFHKKLPLLKKYTSKKARFLWGFAFIFIPTNIANTIYASKVQQQILQSYQLNLAEFMRYRQNGDVTIMNPGLQFAEF